MNQVQKLLDQLIEGYTEEEITLFINNQLPYIITKALHYIEIGPDRYRVDDAFQMPLEEWVSEDLEILMKGCNQVVKGIGFTSERPFTDLGVRGFTLLFSLFHFEIIGKSTKYLGVGRILDQIKVKHVINPGEATFYNLITRN